MFCQLSLSSQNQDIAYVTYILPTSLYSGWEKVYIKSQEEWNYFYKLFDHEPLYYLYSEKPY